MAAQGPSPDFWALLDETRPDLSRLAALLEAMSKDELERYQLAFVEAMWDVSPDWSAGIDTGKYVLSEDGMEDFCAWVVGEGRAVYERATAKDADLVALVALMERAQKGAEPAHPRWAPSRPLPAELRGYNSPHYIAKPIYERRFGTALDDRVEELLDAGESG